MIAFLPSALLIIFGLAIILLYQFRKGLGIPWIMAAAVSILVWAGTALLHWFPTLPVFLIGWNPVESFTNLVGFQLDLVAWPYTFALVSISLAVIFTSAAHLDHIAITPIFWGISLLATGFGFLAVIAATPLAMILTWTLIDVFELILLQGMVRRPSENAAAVFTFAARLMSIFSISIAMIVSRADGAVLGFSNISADAGLFLFLGVLFRLSIIPVHWVDLPNIHIQREPGFLIQSIGLASGLVLLARLPDEFLPLNWSLFFKAAIGLLVLYSAVRWLVSRDELQARPFWVTSLAGMAVISVLNGYQITSMVWGLVLLLMGGVAALYTKRDVRIQFIPALAILSFLGLPFTPAAGMWVGLLTRPSGLFNIIYLIVHILLILGLLKHIFRPGEDFTNLERWTQVVYPAGLMLLILTHWIIATWGWPGSYTTGIWWASLLSVVVIGTGYLLYTRTNIEEAYQSVFKRSTGVFNRYLGQPLTRVLQFSWVYAVLSFLYSILESVTGFITRILEGEGGLLWVMLLLAILITFLFPGGTT